MLPRTPRQQEIYSYMLDYLSRNQNTPPISKVAEYFAITRPVAERHIHALQNQGFVEFTRNTLTEYRLPKVDYADFKAIP
jgi:DNA-binding IclR family transcriptional regulator